MKLVKIIPNDIDIDYHGKTDWWGVAWCVLYVILSWVLIASLIVYLCK